MELEIIYARVGTTRSGRVIPYAPSTSDIGRILLYFKMSEFSFDDLFDAFALFNYLAVRAIRRADGDTIFDRYVEAIEGVFDPHELTQAKNRAHISSAFDLRDLGQSLAAIEFADF